MACDFQQCGILTSVDSDEAVQLWKVKTDNSLCIHLCFCMLAISFYFVNCVIISCELYYDNSLLLSLETPNDVQSVAEQS